MQHLIRWLSAMVSALLPRPRRAPRHALNASQPPRLPDPYVWALPDPREARWRRWERKERRARRTGVPLAPPEDDTCWDQLPATERELAQSMRYAFPPGTMVRPYVLYELGEDWRDTP